MSSFASNGITGRKIHQEIGGGVIDGPAAAARRSRLRWSRTQLKNSLLVAEVLGPPIALRRLDSGPTRPLGWA